MLELKFKAWSKSQRKMYQVDAIDFSGGVIRKDGPCFVENKPDPYGACLLLEDCILLQYTGLQDSKGNDIYDGDILAYNFDDKALFKVQWMKAYSGFQWCKCQIRLSDGRSIDDDEPYDFYGGVDSCYKTVVGNIWTK